MKTATDITSSFSTLYHPKAALVFYEAKGRDSYVEHFDMDESGRPVNAHPLTVREAQALARSLNTQREFLKPKGLLPGNVLEVNPGDGGSVLWYSKAQRRQLYFHKFLGLPDGVAHIPALVWKASRDNLFLYALAGNRRPTEKTALYHAPFFNVYESGSVCMGSVDLQFARSVSLEAFIAGWEDYFFNSYFSHLMHRHNPVKGNCVSLWKGLLETGEAFPKAVLKKNSKTLKNLLQ
ncbi:PRTRC system protein B [Chitinophaga caeni]|uniref:PRTRC system protein B n=1 Tax=Chitinophaga caeni TaxID=2029983 RepID=A0A291QYC6_9BACT|nr:PRTRC system protein B [Chitinophaga caeni]ATL48937.1 PRTRC system protein B [Chitinophaga caeni]